MKKSFLLVFVVLSLLLTVTAVFADDDVIRIGLAAPLTGTNAAKGEQMVVAANIAADELNAAGGIGGKTVEIVAYDDQNDPKEAALVAQRFVDDDSIFAVISHAISSTTLAAAPIYEEAGLSHMAPTSSNVKITQLGYQYVVRHGMRDDRHAPQQVAYIKNNLGKDKFAIVYANTDFGQGFKDNAMNVAEALGMEVVATEAYNVGDKDFSTLLTKIERTGADTIILTGDYTEGGLLLGQAWKMGLTDITWITGSAMTYQKFVELATPEAVQNVYMLVIYFPYDERETPTNFLAKYHETYPETDIPSEPCAFTYDVINVFAQAVEAGATKENLALWIKNLVPEQEEFVAKNLILNSEVTWDANGDIYPMGLQVLKVDPEGNFVATGYSVDLGDIDLNDFAEVIEK